MENKEITIDINDKKISQEEKEETHNKNNIFDENNILNTVLKQRGKIPTKSSKDKETYYPNNEIENIILSDQKKGLYNTPLSITREINKSSPNISVRRTKTTIPKSVIDQEISNQHEENESKNESKNKEENLHEENNTNIDINNIEQINIINEDINNNLWNEELETQFIKFSVICYKSAQKCKHSSKIHKNISEGSYFCIMILAVLISTISNSNLNEEDKFIITSVAGILVAIFTYFHKQSGFSSICFIEANACLELEKMARSIKLELAKSREYRLDPYKYFVTIENQREKLLRKIGIDVD